MDPQTGETQGELLALRAKLERLELQQRNFRDEVDRELIRRAFKIGELEMALQSSEEEFRSTLSWRVTKPLRGLKLLLGELRQR